MGFGTTQQLVKQGAHVVMACRRVEAGEEVAKPLNPKRFQKLSSLKLLKRIWRVSKFELRATQPILKLKIHSNNL